jgi:hypothetical protein
LASQNFGERNSFPLTSRDSSDELIAHHVLFCVSNAERVQNAVSLVLDEVLAVAQVFGALVGDLVAKGKLHRAINGKSWEVEVIYSIVVRSGSMEMSQLDLQRIPSLLNIICWRKCLASL